MKPRNYYIDLIVRYLSGNLTQDKKAELELWMNETSSNRKIFDDYKKTWDSLDRISDMSRMDLHQELFLLRKRMAPAEVRNYTFWLVRIAAILVTALIFSITIHIISRNVGYNSFITDETTMSGSLPDGSQFTLNRGSSLKYPKKYSDEIRTVKLEGEAYFEVKPDIDIPFILSAGEIEIKVLGTSFNIDAYQDNDIIEVIVCSGQVAVTKESQQTERLILKPGNRGTYDKSNRSLKLSVNDDPNFLSWKTREFLFENKSLRDIVSAINNIYNSRITIADDSLSDKKLTVSFTNQSLDAILNVISATLDIEIRQNNSEIILTVKE